MPYNESFDKLIPENKPTFKEEIPAVKDNATFFIGEYITVGGKKYPKEDFNEIFLALLDNDKALKLIADAIQKRTITAGEGLIGGGDLSADRTVEIGALDDSIVVEADGIRVSTYNDINSASSTRPASAGAVKKTYDKSMNPKNAQVFNGTWGDFVKKYSTGVYAINPSVFAAFHFPANTYNYGILIVHRDQNAGADIVYVADDSSRTSYRFYTFNFTNNASKTFVNDVVWKRIDGGDKVSKNGDVMTGTLSIKSVSSVWSEVSFLSSTGSEQGVVGGSSDYVYLRAGKSGSSNVIKIYGNGRAEYPASNLATKSKEVIGAINELRSSLFAATPAGDAFSKHLRDVRYNRDRGHYTYYAQPAAIGLDALGERDTLLVEIQSGSDTTIIRATAWNHGRTYIMTYGGSQGSADNAKWREILTTSNKEFLGQIGVNSIEYIQDNIQKTVGKGYFDKVTKKLYKCIKNADSSITSVNAEYFIPADNISNAIKPHGKFDLLWSGSHYMDGGNILNISNANFDDYTFIKIVVSIEPGNVIDGPWAGDSIMCIGGLYDENSWSKVDLIGDDWAGARLINNHQIKPAAYSGCWIRKVYGVY